MTQILKKWKQTKITNKFLWNRKQQKKKQEKIFDLKNNTYFPNHLYFSDIVKNGQRTGENVEIFMINHFSLLMKVILSTTLVF